MDNYESIERFARQCKANGVRTSIETIKRRYKEIPGIDKENGYRVLEGTRYPIEKNFKIKSGKDRRYWLLKAIDSSRYIDCTMLGIYQNEFELLLQELIQAGYIIENQSPNTYGANKYSTTDKGMDVTDYTKEKAILEIEKSVAEIAGTFTGAIISKIVE